MDGSQEKTRREEKVHHATNASDKGSNSNA
jgi:hypothetical protein